MSNTLTAGEIALISVQGNELYAYINKSELGKDWPDELVYEGVRYELDWVWSLPTQMKSYVQAARYLAVGMA